MPHRLVWYKTAALYKALIKQTKKTLERTVSESLNTVLLNEIIFFGFGKERNRRNLMILRSKPDEIDKTEINTSSRWSYAPTKVSSLVR